MSVELILSEFGGSRGNAGDPSLSLADRFEPALGSFRAVFPDARVHIRTDDPVLNVEGATVTNVDPPFDRAHPRYGWRAHDYYQAIGLLESEADIAVALDADILIVSDRFRALLPLTEAFGLAVPLNPRLMLGIDGRYGSDSPYEQSEDPSQGLAIGYNLTPIAFATAHAAARALLQDYAARMRVRPGRGAVHLSAASLATGFQPHPLPPQWCASSPRDLDSRHIWNEAVALHIGHGDVLPYWTGAPARERRRLVFEKIRGRLAAIRGRT